MAATPASQAKGGKKSRSKKTKIRLYAGLGVVAVLGLLIFVGLQPLTGTIKYGICRVFVEQRLTYPTEMKVVSVEERPQDVRMQYAIINEYGEYIVETVTCAFRPDPQNTWALTEVTLNRQKISGADLIPFNATIPFILANPPSLVLPPPMPVDLVKLQRDN
jgi:hypothetical protein